MSRNRCVIIMPYFGSLPPYFGAYLKSIKNKAFDVLWISDLDVKDPPSNFKIIRITLEQLKKDMTNILGIKVAINDGRRLCDFRPMYGQIFNDLIKDYDYWGWGDCDLVYGAQFNNFLDNVVLSGKFDAISLHKDFLTGPTCFLRNSNKMKCLYKNANNWEEVCAFSGNGGVYIFDECGGQFHSKLFAGEMTLEDCSKIRDSFSAVLWREPCLNIYHEDIINESSLDNGEIISLKQDGSLWIGYKEISVYHFVLAKVPRWFVCKNKDHRTIQSIKIEKYGFYFGKWEWYTRWGRRCMRLINAILSSLKTNGLNHIKRRFFK